MNASEAAAISELFGCTCQANGAILLWFAENGQQYSSVLAEAHSFPFSSEEKNGVLERHYATYCPVGEELQSSLRNVWNTFDSLVFFPSDNDDIEHAIEDIGEMHSRCNGARGSLDWLNKWCHKIKGFFGFIVFICSAVRFVLFFLISANFRRDLLNPFREKDMTTLVQMNGALFWKKDSDGNSSVTLDFLTQNQNIVHEIRAVFARHNIPITVEEEKSKRRWW